MWFLILWLVFAPNPLSSEEVAFRFEQHYFSLSSLSFSANVFSSSINASLVGEMTMEKGRFSLIILSRGEEVARIFCDGEIVTEKMRGKEITSYLKPEYDGTDDVRMKLFGLSFCFLGFGNLSYSWLGSLEERAKWYEGNKRVDRYGSQIINYANSMRQGYWLGRRKIGKENCDWISVVDVKYPYCTIYNFYVDSKGFLRRREKRSYAFQRNLLGMLSVDSHQITQTFCNLSAK